MFRRFLLLFLLLSLAPTGWSKVDIGHEWAAGNAAFDREDWDEAMRHYDAVIQAAPNEEVAYYNRALARVAAAHGGPLDMEHLAKGAPQEAYQTSIQDLTHAIELDPKDADAYMWRAIFRKATNDFSNAVADADTAAALNPQWKDTADAIHSTRAVWWIYYLVAATAGLILTLGGYNLVKTLIMVSKAEKAAGG